MLISEKVTIPKKYLDFVNVFSEKSAVELPEYTDINNHIIDLKVVKQPLYRLIYNPELIELETLKTYIKTKLANGFIKPSKLLANISILFVQKLNESFYLCIDY